MQLRFFDYLVFIVAFMFVSLRGGKVLGELKLNKLGNAIPLNRSGSSALLHGLLFIAVIAIINGIASSIAGQTEQIMTIEKFNERIRPELKPNSQELQKQYNMYKERMAERATIAANKAKSAKQAGYQQKGCGC